MKCVLLNLLSAIFTAGILVVFNVEVNLVVTIVRNNLFEVTVLAAGIAICILLLCKIHGFNKII